MRDSHVPEDFAAMQPAYTGEVSIAEQLMPRLLPLLGWVAAFVELACKMLWCCCTQNKTHELESCLHPT